MSIKIKNREHSGLANDCCKEMYGLSLEELDSLLDQAIPKTIPMVNMLAMSILSDAQYLLDQGDSTSRNLAMKYMNRAKYLMSLVTEAALESDY